MLFSVIYIACLFKGLQGILKKAGGWVQPFDPRASTDWAFALRWQIDGDDQISDGESDYGSAVFSADGDRHRSLLSARDAPPLSRLDRDWQRRGFLYSHSQNSTNPLFPNVLRWGLVIVQDCTAGAAFACTALYSG